MKQLLSIIILVILVFSPCTFAKIQVGEEVVEKFEPPHPYPAVKGVVWEKTFQHPNAGYIAIHFSKFALAANDYLEISSPDGKFYYTFRGKGKDVKDKKGNKKQISTFWATHIPGDTAIVKLVSKSKNNGYGFIIDKWARGYEKGFLQKVMNTLEEDNLATVQSLCGSDDKEWAKCYDGTTMYEKSKSVCRLLINGTGACTGWLVGSEGHVMTNEHCIENQNDADNTDFEFMAEGADCATDCSSWGACPGTVEASSAALIRVDYDLDYALVMLPTNLTSTYGFLQMRNELPTVGERIYIPQHPNHYGKQLAVNSDVDGSYAIINSLNQTPCHGGPGDIGYYGDTDGGSSGSPVIAYSDHLIVSLHHCGTCPNRGVPTTAIITHLGTDLPADAVGGGVLPYCTTYSKNQNYTWIGQVQVADLDNLSTASAYSDFTAKTANLTAGSSVNVTLTPAFSGRSYTLYWKIWIDYNGDGDFADVDEEVFSSSGTAAVSGNFTVPAAASGQKRMRIAMGMLTQPTSCGPFKYGETEDYKVVIQ